VIRDFLRSSYWAKGRSPRAISKSIENSFCFAVYQGEEQVAFARVITDFAVFAYLADVFVLSEHRGRGVAQKMIGAILGHPRLRKIKVFQLATRDAHQLYAKFGFKPLADPERQMKRIRPGLIKVQSNQKAKQR